MNCPWLCLSIEGIEVGTEITSYVLYTVKHRHIHTHIQLHRYEFSEHRSQNDNKFSIATPWGKR